MLRTHGLLTYARNTQLKIAGLLASFVAVGLLIAIAISLTLAMGFAPGTLATKLDSAFRLFVEEWDRILLGGVMWTVIATFLFRRRVQRLLGGEAIDRVGEPRLYNIVENLAISAGVAVPQINIVETAATNAFTTGYSAKHISLTFTRGALLCLNDRQLSAVVAHQLMLVLSGEVRKLSLASTLTGISIFAATWLLKPFYRFSFRTLLLVLALPIFPYAMAGAMITAALAAVLGAVVLKLTVSKLRIFVCDAGALELTKDAEALALAIQTLSMRGVIEGIDVALQPLLFVGPNGGLLDMHPSADARVTAIRSYVPGAASAAPLRPMMQQQEPSWRDSFAIPTWVTGSACSIPLGLFATYCALTSNWSAVDRKAVQALRDDVQVVMEFGMSVADPLGAKYLMTQAKLYKWAYGLELDIDALERAQHGDSKMVGLLGSLAPSLNGLPSKDVEALMALKTKPAPSLPALTVPGEAQTPTPDAKVFMLESSPQAFSEVSYRKDQAHLITAAVKNRSKLSKVLYDAATQCVLKHEDSEIARKLAVDWAGSFSAVAYAESFQAFKRFPLDLEIDNVRRQADGDRPQSELFDLDQPGAQDLMARLRDKGLGTTWTNESCVFQTARKSVEGWVSEADIAALGLRKEYIDAKNAGPDLTPEDKEIVTAHLENVQALEQMQAFEDVMVGKTQDSRLAKAIERLKQAPWNQGYPPLAPIFIPAFILFLFWKMIRGAKWLLGAGFRAIAG